MSGGAVCPGYAPGTSLSRVPRLDGGLGPSGNADAGKRLQLLGFSEKGLELCRAHGSSFGWVWMLADGVGETDCVDLDRREGREVAPWLPKRSSI